MWSILFVINTRYLRMQYTMMLKALIIFCNFLTWLKLPRLIPPTLPRLPNNLTPCIALKSLHPLLLSPITSLLSDGYAYKALDNGMEHEENPQIRKRLPVTYCRVRRRKLGMEMCMNKDMKLRGNSRSFNLMCNHYHQYHKVYDV